MEIKKEMGGLNRNDEKGFVCVLMSYLLCPVCSEGIASDFTATGHSFAPLFSRKTLETERSRAA